jgi:hypothetical protein
MASEETVRRLLRLHEGDRLDQRGVFPGHARGRARDVLDQEETVLASEWLETDAAGLHFTDEPAIAATLPVGRIRRLDADPRIVLIEEVPLAVTAEGPVLRTIDGTMVVDSRIGPAVLTFPGADHELVLLEEEGEIRLFRLQREAPGEGDVTPR